MTWSAWQWNCYIEENQIELVSESVQVIQTNSSHRLLESQWPWKSRKALRIKEDKWIHYTEPLYSLLDEKSVAIIIKGTPRNQREEIEMNIGGMWEKNNLQKGQCIPRITEKSGKWKIWFFMTTNTVDVQENYEARTENHFSFAKEVLSPWRLFPWFFKLTLVKRNECNICRNFSDFKWRLDSRKMRVMRPTKWRSEQCRKSIECQISFGSEGHLLHLKRLLLVCKSRKYTKGSTSCCWWWKRWTNFYGW
jgi:hypothetical protein